MSVFPDIAIDPYLICLPTPCHSAADIEQFVDGLLAWRSALERDDVRVLFSEACLNALLEEGKYPYRHALGEIIHDLGIEEYDPQTVSQVAQSILERVPLIEEFTGMVYPLHDNNVRVVPEYHVDRLDSRIAEAFADTLVLLACYYSAPHHRHMPQCIIASCSPHDTVAEPELSLTATVQEIQWFDDNKPVHFDLPANINEVFRVFFTHDEIMRYVGPVMLWQNAQTEQAVADAIESQISALLEVDASLAGNRLPFCLGPQFHQSIHQCSFHSRSDLAMNLINTCAQIVLGCPKNELKPFRANPAPSAPQHVRADGALAFRTHLTKHGAGYRLMYWQRTDGVIEFANIGVKHELIIH